MKYTHLYQKQKNVTKMAQIIDKIETQNWKVGYFILIGSFVIGQIITIKTHTPTSITEFIAWEANYTAIYLFMGGIVLGFFSPDAHSESINKAVLTITAYNYLVFFLFEVYPRIGETHSEQAVFVVIFMGGLPIVSFGFWLYLLFLSMLGARLWSYITRKFPRYV
jgi:hypothetical protein